MIRRWAPRAVVASGLASTCGRPARATGCRAASRLRRAAPGSGSRCGRWRSRPSSARSCRSSSATRAVVGADVVYRLVGGSFAAFGLVAWHRRPDSRSGPLMTATGFGLLVSLLLKQIHPASR